MLLKVKFVITLFCAICRTNAFPTYEEPVAVGKEVALVVGGAGLSNAPTELFSPEGACQMSLKDIPIGTTDLRRPILALLDKDILACGNSEKNRFCWKLNLKTQEWDQHTRFNHAHDHKPGTVYGGKLYIVDDEYPEVYDPLTNTWTYWEIPTLRVGDDSCLVTRKDTFLLFGGTANPYGVQLYDVATQSWTAQATAATFPIENSACIVLPDNRVLIIGKDPFNNDLEAGAVYDVDNNKWETVLNDKARMEDALVKLSNKVFVIGGISKITEQYVKGDLLPGYYDLTTHRLQPSALALPVSLIPPEWGTCLGV